MGRWLLVVAVSLTIACGGPRPVAVATAPSPKKEAPLAACERPDAIHHRFFAAVAQRFAAHDVAAVEACCHGNDGEPLVAEYCSAARSLLVHEHDDLAFLDTLPASPGRIQASNELDLVLSDFEPEGPEPFELYFRRAWQLAHEGNVRAVEAFVVMFENSSGIFAEAAEGSLCPVFRERPALCERLKGRHPAAVAELRAHCPRYQGP